MTRPTKFRADQGEHREPAVRTKIYVRDDMIGAGKVDLLARLAEVGSISAAASQMGVTDERAEFLLDTLQRCFQAQLFETVSGSTTLTDLGRELLDRHAAHEAAVQEVSQEFLGWLRVNQP